MKILGVVLILLLVILQYKLWFDKDGVKQTVLLHHAIQSQQRQNTLLKARNDALTAEVTDLKHGQDAIEEHARTDMGMIKPSETYYQIVKK